MTTAKKTCFACMLLYCPLGIPQDSAHSSEELFSGVLNPFVAQRDELRRELRSGSPMNRAAAAEKLGHMRAYSAADDLAKALHDKSVDVRREAALALAWCGSRGQIDSLLVALNDDDWSVRQSVCIALMNRTSMDFPFDALAEEDTRVAQADRWRNWWLRVSQKSGLPDELAALLKDPDLGHQLRAVRALGPLGAAEGSAATLKILQPYLSRECDELDALEKHLAQACIRSLGRLQDSTALPVLIGLLDRPAWARYAADALADHGAPVAVAELLAVYPRFSRDLNDPQRPPNSARRMIALRATIRRIVCSKRHMRWRWR